MILRFQVLNSHKWLLATQWGNTDLGCQSPFLDFLVSSTNLSSMLQSLCYFNYAYYKGKISNSDPAFTQIL